MDAVMWVIFTVNVQAILPHASVVVMSVTCRAIVSGSVHVNGNKRI